ncbi:hypothetical protein [Micromonospora cremea]|uniref:hypothetical protein n=1 Tax=Micromonospora cremea TaxID=709881 RepID=UPI00117FF8DC|nr:hypothetical protein [Micromonospora cremea]
MPSPASLSRVTGTEPTSAPPGSPRLIRGPEHAEHFGWTAEELASRLDERRSTVTFEIEPHGRSAVRLVHDGFSPDSEMHRAISGQLDGSGGWPELLASLKTLVETGEPMREPTPAQRAG